MRDSTFHKMIAININFTAFAAAMIPAEEPIWARASILSIVILAFVIGYLVGKYDEMVKKNAAKT